nr:MAG TPA: hypothetical protein [Caudoviricetes sp.]
MRESLIFYQSFARAIKKLPESEQLKALWSIIDYALEDKEPDGDGMYMVVYEMAKPQIDANVERKRNGSRGGRPQKQKEKPKEQKKTVEPVKKKEPPPYQEIIDYLNEKAGKRFKVNEKTKAHINARVNDGYTLADFRAVIEKKVAEWRGTEMDKFLRPETLFGTKFEGYLNQNETVRKKAKSTGFSNFEERNYDFDALERELLGAQEGGT